MEHIMEPVSVIIIRIIGQLITNLLAVDREHHFDGFPFGDLLEMNFEMSRKLLVWRIQVIERLCSGPTLHNKPSLGEDYCASGDSAQ
jgi:hypothetical protein